jgi:cytochrome b6-f complex iron-sulfur subunit
MVTKSRRVSPASSLHGAGPMDHFDDTTASVQTRREFCLRSCQAVSLLTIGAVIPACGGSSTSPSNSAPAVPTVAGSLTGRTLTINIAAGSPLATVGGAATVSVSTGTYLVARTSQTAVTAVTAVCTHEGCAVTGFDGARYVCPCHGSTFTTSGAVVQGPASSPLRQFPATFDATGNVVTISV